MITPKGTTNPPKLIAPFFSVSINPMPTLEARDTSIKNTRRNNPTISKIIIGLTWYPNPNINPANKQ